VIDLAQKRFDFDGYAEAAKVEQTIADLMGRHPITEANQFQWLRFCRTCLTLLHILSESTIEEALKCKS